MSQLVPPIVNGTKGAFLQPSTIGRDESGEYVVLTFQGTKAEVLALVPGIIDGGGIYHVQDSFSGAAVRLEARFPFHVGAIEEPVNDWEFIASRVEKDLLDADVAKINAIPQAEKEKIRNGILSPSDDHSPALMNPTAIAIYQLMLVGVRSYPVHAPVLRHTMTVSSQWAIPASRENVNKVLTTATLQATEGVPEGLLISLPHDVSGQDGLAYGWLKNYPTARIAPWRRIQIQQEWEYGLWPIVIFGNPI